MKSFIEGITGKKIQPYLHVLEKNDEYFFLSEQGTLEQNDSSGLLYVFPVNSDSIKPICKDTFELSKSESPGKSESLSGLLAIKKKENRFMKNCLKVCSNAISECEFCELETHHQRKALRSLYRYIKNSKLDVSKKFLARVVEKRRDFLKQRKRLKNDDDFIFTNLYINGVIPELSSSSMKSMTELVPVMLSQNCENEEEMKKLLHDHFEKVQSFKKFVEDQVTIWRAVVSKVEKATNKLTQPSVVRLMNDSDSPYTIYQDYITSNVEKMRGIVQESSTKIIQIEEQRERNEIDEESENLQLFTDLLSGSYVEKVRELEDEIRVDLSKCYERKKTLDKEFYTHVTTLIDANSKLSKMMVREEKFFSFTNEVVTRSLEPLIFLQNLPIVYKSCISELIRRNKVVDGIKSVLFNMNQTLKAKEDDENEERENFMKKLETEELEGKKFPKELISCIYEVLNVPKLDIKTIDPNLPPLSVLQNSPYYTSTIGGVSGDWGIIDENSGRLSTPISPRPTEFEDKGSSETPIEDPNPLLSQSVVGRMSSQLSSQYDSFEYFYRKVSDTREKEGVDRKNIPDSFRVAPEEIMKKEIEKLITEARVKDEEIEKKGHMIQEIREEGMKKIEHLENAIKEQREKYERKFDDMETRLADRKNLNDQKMKEKEEEVSSLEKQKISAEMPEDFQVEFERMKQENSKLQERLDGKDKQLSLLQGQARQASLKLGQVEEELELLREKNKNVGGVDENKTKMEKKKEMLESMMKVNDLLLQEKQALKEKVEKYEVVIESSKDTLLSIHQENNGMKKKLEGLVKKKDEMFSKTKEQSLVIRKLSKNIRELNEKIEKSKIKLSTLRERVASVSVNIDKRPIEEEGEVDQSPKTEKEGSVSLLQQVMMKYGQKLNQLLKLGVGSSDRFSLLALLLKHDGNVSQCVNDMFKMEEMKGGKQAGKDGKGLGQGKDLRFISVRRFQINDPVLFSKKRSGFWEAFNIYEREGSGKQLRKPTILLHPDCIRQVERIKKTAMLVTGRIIHMEKVRVTERQSDPLNYRRGNYTMCVLTGFSKDSVF